MSRSSKKGPWVEERLMARIEALNAENNKKMLRTWSRTSTIFPEMVGHTLAVHDGKSHGTAVQIRTAHAFEQLRGVIVMIAVHHNEIEFLHGQALRGDQPVRAR